MDVQRAWIRWEEGRETSMRVEEEEEERNLKDKAHSLVGRQEFAPFFIVLHLVEHVHPQML